MNPAKSSKNYELSEARDMEQADWLHLIIIIMSGCFVVLSFVPEKMKLASGVTCVVAILGFVVRYFGFAYVGNLIAIVAGVAFAAIAAHTIAHITREGL
ncbi:hypothetical protein [Sphingobium yanoikuyae]|uniref:hypothetical protein n=1 Tax=Sphingobium yanoikuyae TaxID=13690 RepID=UPI00111317C9|nr:hypothetical protein [Sphingobium yanoikuyae]